MARNTEPTGRNFNIDVKRLFLHLMDDSDVDNADPNLRDRAPDRQQQRNHPQDRLTSEPLRFEHHNHQDEYLIGSVLIADPVKHVEVVIVTLALVRSSDQDPPCTW